MCTLVGQCVEHQTELLWAVSALLWEETSAVVVDS